MFEDDYVPLDLDEEDYVDRSYCPICGGEYAVRCSECGFCENEEEAGSSSQLNEIRKE